MQICQKECVKQYQIVGASRMQRTEETRIAKHSDGGKYGVRLVEQKRKYDGNMVVENNREVPVWNGQALNKTGTVTGQRV